MTVRNLAPRVAVSVESILSQKLREFRICIRDDKLGDTTPN